MDSEEMDGLDEMLEIQGKGKYYEKSIIYCFYDDKDFGLQVFFLNWFIRFR
jgi:hypothetical protein